MQGEWTVFLSINLVSSHNLYIGDPNEIHMTITKNCEYSKLNETV